MYDRLYILAILSEQDVMLAISQLSTKLGGMQRWTSLWYLPCMSTRRKSRITISLNGFSKDGSVLLNCIVQVEASLTQFVYGGKDLARFLHCRPNSGFCIREIIQVKLVTRMQLYCHGVSLQIYNLSSVVLLIPPTILS